MRRFTTLILSIIILISAFYFNSSHIQTDSIQVKQVKIVNIQDEVGSFRFIVRDSSNDWAEGDEYGVCYGGGEKYTHYKTYPSHVIFPVLDFIGDLDARTGVFVISNAGGIDGRTLE